MLVFNETRHARSSRAEASPEVVLLSARGGGGGGGGARQGAVQPLYRRIKKERFR